VTLRPRTDEDRSAIIELLAHPEVLSWWGPYDDERFARDFLVDGIFTYIIEHDDEPAGLIQFTEEADPDYRHAAVDITIAGGFLERGLGTDALRALLSYLVGERGHHRVTIDPTVSNGRGIHVYEKVGFRPVGVMRKYERSSADGTWHDNLLMDLLAEEIAEP
jgi:aminoglycoside 6'-N-acetyltransferase